MAKPITDPPGFAEATIEEQIEYLTDLWDRISVDPDRIPVPQSHLDLALERLAAHRANPEDSLPAIVALQRILQRYR
ncbi:MAG: addiction module protein [Fimbriimonadaceae bacterium]|nr:addiction module protein [Fimbriimonadaceae bacterium]